MSTPAATDCPFCTLPLARIVHANQFAVVIRDAYPVSRGHTLVLPRRHKGSFFELEPPERDAVFELLDVARRDLDQSLHPDGYTIGFGAISTNALNPHVYKAMAFDPRKDFAGISMLGYSTIVLEVPADTPIKSVADLVAFAKKNPGLTYGTAGAGTSMHLSGVLFAQTTQTDLTHVAYKGSNPAINDMIGGHIKVMFDNLPASLPHIQSGKLRALAVAGAARSPSLPDVPTLAEAGLKGYAVDPWFGVFGPANMPPAVVKKIHDDVAEEARKGRGSAPIWVTSGATAQGKATRGARRFGSSGPAASGHPGCYPRSATRRTQAGPARTARRQQPLLFAAAGRAPGPASGRRSRWPASGSRRRWPPSGWRPASRCHAGQHASASAGCPSGCCRSSGRSPSRPRWRSASRWWPSPRRCRWRR